MISVVVGTLHRANQDGGFMLRLDICICINLVSILEPIFRRLTQETR